MASQTNGVGPPQKPRPSAGSKREQVQLACNTCRRRKIKCDGTRPRCNQCSSRDSDCDWARESDELPQVALKRKYDDLERRSAGEHEVFGLLQSVSEFSAIRILAQLREASNITDVLDFARGLTVDSTNGRMLAARQQNMSNRLQGTPSRSESSLDRDLQPLNPSSRASQSREEPAGLRESSRPTLPPLASILPEFENRIRHDGSRKTLRRSPSAPDLYGSVANTSHTHAESPTWLPDPKLERAKCSHWGINYVDDQTFRKILSYFFVWDFPVLHWFDEEDLLRGIAFQTSEITSPLTINLLLAWGARNYAHIDPVVAALVHDAAFNETKRLWDLALSNNDRSLATAAAGIMLPWLFGANSLDQLSVKCCHRACEIMEEFGLFDEQRVDEVYHRVAPETSRARAAFAWGSLNSATMNELSWRGGDRLPKPPPVPMPPPSPKRIDDLWAPWPAKEPRLDAHTHEITTARSALYIIVYDMVVLQRRFLKKQLTAEYLAESLALNRRYQNWYDTLSPALTALESAAPQTLILHLLYHYMIVALFGPFTTHPSSSSPSSIPLLNAHLPLEPAVSAAITAAIQLRHLLDRFATLYQTSPVHFIICPPAMTVAFETASSASPLSPTYHPSARTSFLTAIKLLKRVACTIPFVSFALMGLQQAAVRSGWSLPAEAEAELKALKRDRAGVEELKTSWVVDVKNYNSEDDAGRLGTLIKEMEDIDLGKDDARDGVKSRA